LILALVAIFTIGTGAEEPAVNKATGALRSEGISSDSSTVIEIERFEAIPASLRIALEWETTSEPDLEGFHIQESMDGEDYSRVTPAIIPAAGGPLSGDVYSYVDYDVIPGVTYSYILEEINIHGDSSCFGPVSATAAGLCGAIAGGVGGYGVLWVTVLIVPAAFMVELRRRSR